MKVMMSPTQPITDMFVHLAEAHRHQERRRADGAAKQKDSKLSSQRSLADLTEVCRAIFYSALVPAAWFSSVTGWFSFRSQWCRWRQLR
jgi:hypothetical protein